MKKLPFAVFDEFGRGADARVQDYVAAAVAAERERCAAMCAVEAAHSGVAHTGRTLLGLAQRIRTQAAGSTEAGRT